MNNHNKINDFNNIGNILPQQTMFNFNNINININQYNNNTQYINNNINSNMNINNNQFNLIRQYPNAVINYNQFVNYNYPYQNNNQYRNYNNHGNYRRGRGRTGGWQKKNYKNRQYQNSEEEVNKKNKIDWIAYNKLKTIEEKREFMGEVIFRMIEQNEIIKNKNVSKEQIGKITGMIIELPNIYEVIEVAENNEILNDRIEEALNLLEGQ